MVLAAVAIELGEPTRTQGSGGALELEDGGVADVGPKAPQSAGGAVVVRALLAAGHDGIGAKRLIGQELLGMNVEAWCAVFDETRDKEEVPCRTNVCHFGFRSLTVAKWQTDFEIDRERTITAASADDSAGASPRRACANERSPRRLRLTEAR